MISLPNVVSKYAFVCQLRRLFVLSLSIASLACMPSFASKVTLGMSTVLSGPAEALGQGVKLGVEVAFKEFNKNNAQSGIILSLKALDDGYEPKRAAPNMRQFAQDQDILAVIGNVGTPTAIVSVPVANEMKLPLLGAFTGAGVLRKMPPDRYIFNGCSYDMM